MSATELLFTDQWHAIPLADLEEGSREKNVEVRKAGRAASKTKLTRSNSARIGKYKMAASGGHVDRIKYAECTNSLSIFLIPFRTFFKFSFPRSTCSLPKSFATCITLSTYRDMEKIIDRSDESRMKSK